MKFKNIHVYSKERFATWLAGAKKEAADAKAGRAGQPRPGGLQLLGLRRLPHVYAGQVDGYSRPEAR